LLGPLVGQRLHNLIAAHPDIAVNQPHRQHDPVPAEGAVPGERVLVVGVDERPVDVEHGDRHPSPPTR
jgi:hypothetical protein